VYATLAAVLLQASDQYALLHYAAAFRPDKSTQSILPSWVPDWRVRPRVRPFLHPDFRCGLGRPGNVQVCADGSITMQGSIVDWIASDDKFVDGEQKTPNDFGMALSAFGYQEAIEKVGNLRGNIHSEASRNGIVTAFLIHHQSLKHAKVMIDETAGEFKGSSSEHALQASWSETRHANWPTGSDKSVLQNEALRGRRFFKTEQGNKGVGPVDAEQGDAVVVLCGTRTPFIMRQSLEGTAWSIVGDAWISGCTAEVMPLRASTIEDLRIV
jgi:hypothetical protein